MNERIARLVQKTIDGNMWVECITPEFELEDIFLSPVEMAGKRIHEYIMLQEPIIAEESCMTGFIRFEPRRGWIKNEIVGDIFGRSGHTNLNRLDDIGYGKPWYKLTTFEWQHSVGNFSKIINIGIKGVLAEIEKSMEKYKDDAEKTEFLKTQILFCNTLIEFAHKCAKKAIEVSQKTQNPEYKQNLELLADTFQRIPENPAESFYEAVLMLYFLYAYLPDSIGLIDRYLYPYYRKDLDSGVITQDKAKEYLQELFCMLQAKTLPDSGNWTKGAECHFAVGGYLENGEDGFNDFSKLIVDSLLELPTWAPEISLRWTEKTPREVFKYMMECERRDPNKRIAFVNDEPRIKTFMDLLNMSFEEAVNYTTTGCNELTFHGGSVWANEKVNIVRSLENTLYNRCDDIVKATDFEEFYGIYEEELLHDLNEAQRISEEMQKVRNRDFNIVSNFLLEGSIENGISCTKKGGVKYISAISLLGMVNVFDSLSIVKQFVYDEKLVSMETLLDALKSNWNGYEDLHAIIIKKGRFFGNDDEKADSVALKILDSISSWNNADNYFEQKWLFSTHVGYNDHHRTYGQMLRATPDGRYDGDLIKFGMGQSEGKDRQGLTALLNSISGINKNMALTGASVTNILLDEALVRNDASFDMLISALETYFKNGGIHFQLSYVSHDDLVKAKITPDKYSSLRVRVSGFSEYFVNLNEGLQDDILARTSHS